MRKKLLLFITVACIVCLAFGTYVSADTNSAASYIKTAKKLIDQEKFGEAIKMLDKAIKLNPKSADAYVQKAMAYYIPYDDVNADKYFDQAIRLNPKSADAYNGKAMVCLDLGKYKEALEFSNKAIKLNKKCYDGYSSKAQALSSMEKPDEAIKVLKQAISMKPDYVWYYDNMAGIMIKLGKPQEAAVYCKTALKYAKLKREKSEIYFLYAISLQLLYQYEESIQYVDKALNEKSVYLKMNSQLLYTSKAFSYLKLGESKNSKEDFEKATESANMAIKVDASYSEPYFYNALAYDKLDNTKESLVNLKKAVDMDASYKDYIVDYIKLGYFEKQVNSSEFLDIVK